MEEKPAAIGIGVGVLIAIWAASGLIDAIDKLPLVGGLLELVGLVVTGWFAYRYLIFGPDRSTSLPLLLCFLPAFIVAISPLPACCAYISCR